MGSMRYWSYISIGSCTRSLKMTQRCDVHNAGRASPQQRRNNRRSPVQFPSHALRLSSPGDGGNRPRSPRYTEAAHPLSVTPRVAPLPCDLGGVAPPARPSDVGAACGDPLPALGVLSQSQDLDIPWCRGLRRSVPGHGVPAPDHTGVHTRFFGKASRCDCRDEQPRQLSCCGLLSVGSARRWRSGAAGEWGCAYAAQEVQEVHSRRCCGKIACKISILQPYWSQLRYSWVGVRPFLRATAWAVRRRCATTSTGSSKPRDHSYSGH